MPAAGVVYRMPPNTAPAPVPTASILPPVPLSTILVSTDFSAPAAEAENLAANLARQSGARLILLHVIADSDYVVGEVLGVTGGIAERFRAQARAAMQGALEERLAALRATGVEVEGLLADGRAGDCIVETAKLRAADLIVLSTHGRRGWRRMLLGSVAERVVRQASCPVLTVHAHAKAAGGKIVVPTDFSPPAAKALQYAEHFARLSGAALTLVHIFEVGAVGPGLPGDPAFEFSGPEVQAAYDTAREEIWKRLQSLAAEVTARGVRAEPLLLHGNPAEQIASAAEHQHASLIVVSTHGWSGWRHFVLGSTAEAVVRLATCPVLVVREQERDFLPPTP